MNNLFLCLVSVRYFNDQCKALSATNVGIKSNIFIDN